MKKLIFLLLVLMLGFSAVFAVTNPEHPPGVLDPETALIEYNVQQNVVTRLTVLVISLSVELARFQTVVYDYVLLPQPLFEQIRTAPDYYLRC